LDERGSLLSTLTIAPSYSANVTHFYSSLPNTIRPRNSHLYYTVCTNTANVKSRGKVKKFQQMILLMERFR